MKIEDKFETLFNKYNCMPEANDDFKLRTKEIWATLMKTLEKDERDLFIDYTDAYNQFIDISSDEKFRQGFWIGFGIMRELAGLD